MSKNENLLNNINDFFRKQNIGIIQPENSELKNLFEESLKNIWISVANRNTRKVLRDELSVFFIPFFKRSIITGFLDNFCGELDKNYPGEGDFIELYNICLKSYSRFLEEYRNDDKINNSLLNDIISKIVTMINENTNSIFSRIGQDNEEYSEIVFNSINSTIIALIGGMKLGYSEEQLLELGMSGLVHDLGMSRVPADIINKEGRLTMEEFSIVKTHVTSCYKILKAKNIFSEAILDAVVQHHEQFDGNGYPRKLKGADIAEYARILAVADAIVAQLAHRAYRPAKSGYLTMKDIISNANNKFDPAILKVYLSVLSIYPPGTLVQLNDNSIGVVEAINRGAPLRPVVKTILDSEGNKITGKILVNLKESPDVFIVYVLNRDEYRKKE